MEKLVYVVWKRTTLSDSGFLGAVREDLCDHLVDSGASGITANLLDPEAASVSKVRITHLDPPPSGFLSFWLDATDDRGPIEIALASISERLAGYLVVESVPLRNTTAVAPLGERTPGINVVALIEKPDWIEADAWIDHWHGHHREVALETQCSFLYVRNVVVRALTPDAPPWAGIVEESFPTEAITDPMRWYKADGDPERLKANLARMIESCQAFLDLDRVETHPMSRYCMTALQP